MFGIKNTSNSEKRKQDSQDSNRHDNDLQTKRAKNTQPNFACPISTTQNSATSLDKTELDYDEFDSSQRYEENNQDIYELFKQVRGNKISVTDFHAKLNDIEPEKYFQRHVNGGNNKNIFHYLSYFKAKDNSNQETKKFQEELSNLFDHLIRSSSKNYTLDQTIRLMIDAKCIISKRKTPISALIKAVAAKNYSYVKLIISYLLELMKELPDEQKFILDVLKLDIALNDNITKDAEFNKLFREGREVASYLIVDLILESFNKSAELGNDIKKRYVDLILYILNNATYTPNIYNHSNDLKSDSKYFPMLIQIFRKTVELKPRESNLAFEERLKILTTILEPIFSNPNNFSKLDIGIPQSKHPYDANSNLLLYAGYHFVNPNPKGPCELFKKLLKIKGYALSSNANKDNVLHQIFSNPRINTLAILQTILNHLEKSDIMRLLSMKNDSGKRPLDCGISKFNENKNNNNDDIKKMFREIDCHAKTKGWPEFSINEYMDTNNEVILSELIPESYPLARSNSSASSISSSDTESQGLLTDMLELVYKHNPQLKSEHSRLRAEVESLKLQIVTINLQLEEKEFALTQAFEQNSKYDQELTNLKELLQQENSKNQELTEENQSLAEKFRDYTELKKQLIDLNSTYKKLQEEKSVSDQELKDLTIEINKLKAENKEQKTALNEKDRSFKKTNLELMNIKQQFKTLNEKYMALEQKAKEDNSTINKLTDSNTALKVQVEKLEEDKAAKENVLQSLQPAFEKLGFFKSNFVNAGETEHNLSAGLAQKKL